MQRLLNIFAGVVLFWVCVYPLLAVQIYTPWWYQASCVWHERCEQLGQAKAEQAISELSQFWQHRGELSSMWTPKEQAHLLEVRPMFDAIFWVFLLAVLLGMKLITRVNISGLALGNALSILSLLLLLPFFEYFWIDVFHPLLFDNMNWNNTRADISWYLMPKSLFFFGLIALIAWVFTVNMLIWLRTRKR